MAEEGQPWEFQTHLVQERTWGVHYRQAVFPYDAESDVELNLSSGDYVFIRKVSNNGWAEGECKGKAGWFPVEYVERRERVLASKVTQVF